MQTATLEHGCVEDVPAEYGRVGLWLGAFACRRSHVQGLQFKGSSLEAGLRMMFAEGVAAQQTEPGLICFKGVL